MFGIEMIDLVPAGTIEDMVRANGPDIVQTLMRAMREKFDLAPDERMSFHFVETEQNGKPCTIVLPIILSKDLVPLRKLPYYNVGDMLRTAPVAKYIMDAKAVKKVVDKLEVLVPKLTAASAFGGGPKADALLVEIRKLIATVPPRMVKLLGFDHLLPAPPAQLPPAEKPRQLAAATESGDTTATAEETDPEHE
jgi:hypothetical protein